MQIGGQRFSTRNISLSRFQLYVRMANWQDNLAGQSWDDDKASRILGTESPFYLQHYFGESMVARHMNGGINLSSGDTIP